MHIHLTPTPETEPMLLVEKDILVMLIPETGVRFVQEENTQVMLIPETEPMLPVEEDILVMLIPETGVRFVQDGRAIK